MYAISNLIDGHPPAFRAVAGVDDAQPGEIVVADIPPDPVWDAGEGILRSRTTVEKLQKAKTDSKARIDAAAGAIRARFVSPGSLIEQEYLLAETQALEYKAAGYPAAPVPECVQSWSDEGGMTPQQAADNIIATAMFMRSRLELIRRPRLAGKRSVDAASDLPAVAAAEAAAVAALNGLLPA